MNRPPITALPDSPGDDAPRSPGGGQESNRQKLRALIIGPVIKQNLTTGQSKELPSDDLLQQLTADGRVIEPPFDKLVLAMLPEQSTELGQVIEAMVQNIEGFGFRLECRVRIDDPDCPVDLKNEALAEKSRLINFFKNCCVDHSFTELRKRTRTDLETTGEAYWEIIRVPGTDQIIGLNHLPSYQMRLGRQDKDFTKFERATPVVKPDGTIELETVTYQKRFRGFIQARVGFISRSFAQTYGGLIRWFKSFGDPRIMNNENGDIVEEGKEASVPEEKRASEMLHHRIYSSRTPYGLPRFIGNLITVFGDRAADEVNFITLKNNNIPSMVILVSNGQLTDGSIQRIREFVETQIQPSDNYSRFLLLEGEGQFEGPDAGQVKINIQPLTNDQHKDQLFQEYGKNNREKIREAFRLPPIFVGRSDDYTRATAEASRRLADEQVFKPERDEFDEMINKMLLPAMGVRFHTFRSNGPNVTDDEDLIRILATAERTGGMTPRIARIILADIFGREDLPAMDPSIKPDVPFSLQMAEAIKNTAPIDAQLAVKSRDGILAELLGLRDDLESELGRKLDR